MVIRLQRYNGKDMRNHCVRVDYAAQKVTFKPIGKKKPIRDFVADVLATLIITMVPMAVIFVLFSVASLFMETRYTQTTLSYIVLVAMILSCCATVGKWISKRWRTERYPQWQKLQVKLFETVFLLHTRRLGKPHKITARQMKENMIIVPSFSNVEFTYKATKDFAVELKEIDIRNTFDKDPAHWFAIITFNKRPQRGWIEITYM